MFDPCREHVADGGAASHGLGLEPFLEHGVELHRDLGQLDRFLVVGERRCQHVPRGHRLVDLHDVVPFRVPVSTGLRGHGFPGFRFCGCQALNASLSSLAISP